jgi:hypothetical protein
LVGSDFPYKNKTSLEETDYAKHSSLLRYGIDNYARKNVYDTVPRNAIFFIFKERRVVETTKLKFGQLFKTFLRLR